MPRYKPPVYKPGKLWAADGMHLLEAAGLVANSPPIRSRDFDYCGTDPFRYYLCRRLGLQQPFEQSEALSLGSWFHKALELVGPSISAFQASFRAALEARLRELTAMAKTMQLAETSIVSLRERTSIEALTALAWFQSALTYSNPRSDTLRDGVHALLCNSNRHVIARELIVDVPYTSGDSIDATLRIQIDRLELDLATNLLWLWDCKTSSFSPRKRYKTLFWEPQPVHYIHVLAQALQDRAWRQSLNIPLEAKLGGIKHLIVYKPTIKFGGQDRNYGYIADGKRSGWKCTIIKSKGNWYVITTPPGAADNGTPERFLSEKAAVEHAHKVTGKTPEKVFDGEPSPDNYSLRCSNWFRGEGDFEDNAVKFADDPPIMVSTIRADQLLTGHRAVNYATLLDTVIHYSKVVAHPSNFPVTGEGQFDYTNLSVYAPFYDQEPQYWPAVVKEGRFVQVWD